MGNVTEEKGEKSLLRRAEANAEAVSSAAVGVATEDWRRDLEEPGRRLREDQAHCKSGSDCIAESAIERLATIGRNAAWPHRKGEVLVRSPVGGVPLA